MDPGHVNLINKFGGITKYTKAVQLLTKSPENGFPCLCLIELRHQAALQCLRLSTLIISVTLYNFQNK